MLPTVSPSTVTDAWETRWTRALNAYELSSLPEPALDSTFVPVLLFALPSPSESESLPFDDFEFVDGDMGQIAFETGARRFECDLGEYMCMVGDTLPDDTPFVESPDERWEAFVTDHNLFIRPVGGGDTIQLTTDGEKFNGYGLAYPRPNDIRNSRVRRPDVYWSPDSRRILVQRMDQRDVEHHHYVSYTPQRTVHYSQPYALPGDSIVPLPAFHILDVGETLSAAAAGGSGSDGDAGSGADAGPLPEVGNIRVVLEPRPNRLYLAGSQVDSLWSADSRFAYMHWETRASKSNHLAEVGRLDASGDRLTLALSEKGRVLYNDLVARRFEALARALGRTGTVADMEPRAPPSRRGRGAA